MASFMGRINSYTLFDKTQKQTTPGTTHVAGLGEIALKKSQGSTVSYTGITNNGDKVVLTNVSKTFGKITKAHVTIIPKDSQADVTGYRIKNSKVDPKSLFSNPATLVFEHLAGRASDQGEGVFQRDSKNPHCYTGYLKRGHYRDSTPAVITGVKVNGNDITYNTYTPERTNTPPPYPGPHICSVRP